MAISEACKFEIKEEVDKLVDDKGVSKAEAFRQMTSFFNSIGVKIKEATVQRKYYRASEPVTNVTPKSQPTETITNSSPEIIKDRKPQGGGSREGAGRPPKELFICKQCEREFESNDFAYEIDGGRCSACQQRSPANNSKYTDPNAKSDAIFITSIIISQLERIKKNDPKRQEAFGIIIKWIEANK